MDYRIFVGAAALLAGWSQAAAAADSAPGVPAAATAARQAKPATPSDPATTAPPKIPVATFVSKAGVRDAQLSADGTKLLFKLQTDTGTYVSFRAVGGSDMTSVPIPPNADLNWFRWAGNHRILMSLSTSVNLFGDEFRQSLMLSYDIATKTMVRIGRKQIGFRGDDLLYVDPQGEYLVMALTRSVFDNYPQVDKVMLADNKAEMIQAPKQPVFDWYTDDAGALRLGIGHAGTTTSVYYRKTADEPFKVVAKVSDNSENEEDWYDARRLISGSDEGYVLSNKETGRFGLYKYNFATRTLGEKVFDDPRHDVTGYDIDDDTHALRAAYYTDERDRIKWFEPKMAALQAKLDRAVKGQEAWVYSLTDDEKKMLVLATSPTDPGSYFLYEPEKKSLARFAGINDALDPAQLSETRYVWYKARDGKDIPAYLTLPRGRTPKGLPLVILPHGGPYGVRDKLDYDVEVQFLANRGYAVIQPNYRGSDGYGKAFTESGYGQIGRAMQDDLDDAMDWLAKEGTIDPKRVCVVGASYGGYAALWSVIRNPERYRCAASYAGVTDFRKILTYDAQFFTNRNRRKWNAKVKGDDDFNLDSISPAKQAARLTRPVLLVHGTADTVVPFNQDKAFVAALKDAGKTVETQTYKDEIHGFSKPANLQDWLERLDAFLAKSNPAG